VLGLKPTVHWQCKKSINAQVNKEVELHLEQKSHKSGMCIDRVVGGERKNDGLNDWIKSLAQF